MIFFPILRATLGSDSAAPRRAPPPRTSEILPFPSGISMIFLPVLRSTLGLDSARPRCSSAPLTPEILHFPSEFH